MAHANQERWAALVDAKLRSTLVTRDGLIFNDRYEGTPVSGKVKIPVRDTEVAVKEYDKANGVAADAGTTTYLDLNIDHDEAVNELIDGYDAASVPDGIVADRLDSAGYSRPCPSTKSPSMRWKVHLAQRSALWKQRPQRPMPTSWHWKPSGC